MAMTREAEFQAYLLLRIADDPDFRDRMVNDPKATIEAETGAPVPADRLVFVQDAIEAAQQEEGQEAEPLTRAELNQVVGGVKCADLTKVSDDWYDDCEHR